MYCTNCGEPIPEKSNICPKCGKRVGTHSQKYQIKNRSLVVTLILLILVVIVVVVFFTKGKENDRIQPQIEEKTNQDNFVKEQSDVTEESSENEILSVTEEAENQVTIDDLIQNVYQQILDSALEKQILSLRFEDELQRLNYLYFYYDFNQDGYDELLLYEDDGYSWGTIYLYSYVDGKVRKIWEYQDETYYEGICALTENGLAIWGTMTNGCEEWKTFYHMENNTMVHEATFYEMDYVIDEYTEECSYTIYRDGREQQVETKAEYDDLLEKYEQDHITQTNMQNVWQTIGQ